MGQKGEVDWLEGVLEQRGGTRAQVGMEHVLKKGGSLRCQSEAGTGQSTAGHC